MASPQTSAQPATASRETTWPAIIFGILIGALMNASITYAGLKIGFTIGGSAVGAILGFGILRGLLRQGHILEINICQTVASAVNIPNSGVIFTVPVLLLIDHERFAFTQDGAPTPLFWMLTLACSAGAILGCAFIIPLRKQMIDIERLRFPTGVAVAAILKSPGAGIRKTYVLLAGILLGMVVYLPVALPEIIKNLPEKSTFRKLETVAYERFDWRLPGPQPAAPNNPDDAARYARELQDVDHDGDDEPDLILSNDLLDVGRWWGLPDEIPLAFAIAPFALGAGYVTGRAGLFVLAGGVLAYFVLNPVAFAWGWFPVTVEASEVANVSRSAFNRPLGIGMLLGGALIGMLASLPSVRAAFAGLGKASKSGRGSDELGIGVLVLAALLAIAGLYFAADYLETHDTSNVPPAAEAGGEAVDAEPAESDGWLSALPSHWRNLLIALIGAAWIWFGGIIIAQCTGMTDWSPISGMALLTIVLVMLLTGTQNVTGSVLIGAAMCVAITCAADMMQDLKTGYMVGAIPKRQQSMELLLTGLGPPITMATLILIAATNMRATSGEPVPEVEPRTAQTTEEVATGKPMGPGTKTEAPQAQALQAVILGVQGGDIPYALYGCGSVLGVLLGVAAFPSLGVLIGLSMYLPIAYILTYGVGCLINMFVSWWKGARWSEEWGVPFGAGLIVGEALLSLVLSGVDQILSFLQA